MYIVIIICKYFALLSLYISLLSNVAKSLNF